MVLCCGQYQSRAHFLITEVVQNAQVVLIVQPHHHMLGLLKSASHSKSGNTATARATATQKTSTGTKDFSMSVTIKCSSNGTIS